MLLATEAELMKEAIELGIDLTEIAKEIVAPVLTLAGKPRSVTPTRIDRQFTVLNRRRKTLE